MAGGIGSRFWPVSRNDRPKQFLDFFGTGKSLLQMTVDRFRPLVPLENMLIVTNVRYKSLIMEQIPDLAPFQILYEPCRRNTAPCVAYAVAHIKAIMRARTGNVGKEVDWDSDEMNANLIVAPSDHLIMQESKFLAAISKGLDYITNHDNLLTLGMRPTRPETGYGYIQMMSESGKSAAGFRPENTILPVKTFTEKPNLELARIFCQSGEFLWNSGIFLWNLRTIRHAFREFLPDLVNAFLEGEDLIGTPEEDAFMEKMFPTCPNISIDYGVMEKASGVHVMCTDFGWSDLGTWGSLYDLCDKNPSGNVVLKGKALYYDSHGNIVTLPEGKLAVIQGMDDMIVAESDNVLLICKKDAEQQIRQFVTDAEVKFEGNFS